MKMNKIFFLARPPPLYLDLDFFQNSGRVTGFTLLNPNFMQSLKKTNERSREIFKNRRTILN